MSSLEKKNDEIPRRGKAKSIGIIFRYADSIDVLLMVMGTIGAIGDGMSTNILLVFASRIMNSVGYGQTQHNQSANFMIQVQKVSSRNFNFFS